MKNILMPVLIFLFVLCTELMSETGMWVVRDQLTSEQQIDSIFNFARRHHITHLFVQVRGRGRVLYQSHYEEKEDEAKTFDALRYVLERNKDYGLKIHAWVNMFLIWSREDFPPEENHPVNRFRNHIIRDLGNQPLDDIYRNMVKKGKIEGFYLSPANPDIQKYLVDILKEIVMKYPVYGIHLDYFRYPKLNFVLDFHFLNYLSNRYGITFGHFLEENRRGDGFSIEDYRGIAELMSRPLEDLLRQFREWQKKYYPEIVLSVAVKPNPAEALLYYYQNWDRWIENDLIDFVCPMNYTTNMDQFKKNCDILASRYSADKIWMGLAVYNKSWQSLRAQMECVQKTGFHHKVYFSYKYLKNYDGLVNLTGEEQ